MPVEYPSPWYSMEMILRADSRFGQPMRSELLMLTELMTKRSYKCCRWKRRTIKINFTLFIPPTYPLPVYEETFNSLFSGGGGFDLKCAINFQIRCRDCSHEPWGNGTAPYWWLIFIGTGNGLVPSGNTPLAGPMLTKIHEAIWSHYAMMS